jgi:hypothetical protein
MHTVFQLKNLEGGDHLQELGVDGKIRMDLSEMGRCGMDSSGSE